MREITEAEFAIFLQTKAVRLLKVIQTEQKKYKVVVNLTVKPGDWTVAKVRGGVREWIRIDRIFDSIYAKCHDKAPQISVILDLQFKPTEEEKQ
jgi:hypothetical protein